MYIDVVFLVFDSTPIYQSNVDDFKIFNKQRALKGFRLKSEYYNCTKFIVLKLENRYVHDFILIGSSSELRSLT